MTVTPPFDGAGVGIFDGSSGYISTPYSSDLNLGSANLAIEFFFNLSNVTAEKYLFTLTEAPSAYYPIAIELNSGVIVVILYDGTWKTITSGSINTDTWYSLLLNVMSGTARLYIGGTETGTYKTLGSLQYNENATNIGRRSHDGKYMAGMMSELRVSNISRQSGNYTPQTVQFVSDANTVMLLRFDGQGKSVKDYSPSPHDVMGYGGFCQWPDIGGGSGVSFGNPLIIGI